MTKLELDQNEYGNFLRCLSVLKDVCNDVDIQGGFIRQRSNDLTTVFEMNLQDLFGEINLPISDTKRKLDLFKIFSGTDVSIEIVEVEEESDSYFEMTDNVSVLKFNFPARDFFDNKFMSTDELNKIFDLSDDNLILHDQLDTLVTDRIRIISENFNTNVIQVVFEDDKASIISTAQSKDQHATLKSEVPLNIAFEEKSFANLSVVQFCLEHDGDLEFKMYQDPEKNILLNKVSTNVGNIPVNVYSRSLLNSETN